VPRLLCTAVLLVVFAIAMGCGSDMTWSVSESTKVREHAEGVAEGRGNPNARLGRNMPALFAAVVSGDCEAADTLLSHGADPAANWQGWTPLQEAARGDGSGCAEVLLRHGADPNQRVRGASPVILASNAGDAETLRALVDHGARVDVAYDREFPIQRAARNGNAEAVRVLLSAGADPNTRGPDGGNPLHIAAAAGNDEAAAVLFEAGSRLTEIPSDPWTTARTYEWAARHAERQRDMAAAVERRGIACEYFPLARADLASEKDADEAELSIANERTDACERSAGDDGLRPPPWSPARPL